MAFGVAGPWGNTVASKVKLNLMTIVSGAGADLATLDFTKHSACRCTSTGSGFTLGHFYVSDNTQWIDVSVATSHTHESAITGGTFFEILAASGNKDLIDTGGFLMFAADVAKWTTSHTSTANEANDLDGTTAEKSIKLTTGTTSGSRASISMPGGVEMDFGKPSMWQAKTLLTTLSSLNFRWGFHVDNVSSADSNNINYGIEICTATNNNYWARSASGSNKSAEDTTIAATTNRQGTRGICRPDLSPARTITYVDASSGYTKTTDIPVTNGASPPGTANIFRFSTKNSTTADRPLFVYASRWRYYGVSDWV
jgi:hypothetical protein